MKNYTTLATLRKIILDASLSATVKETLSVAILLRYGSPGSKLTQADLAKVLGTTRQAINRNLAAGKDTLLLYSRGMGVTKTLHARGGLQPTRLQGPAETFLLDELARSGDTDYFALAAAGQDSQGFSPLWWAIHRGMVRTFDGVPHDRREARQTASHNPAPPARPPKLESLT